MRIAKIINSDVVNGIGVSTSVFVQGCPFHCKGCFNPETWDFNGGKDIENIFEVVKNNIVANGIQRNLSILGGEPLCPENRVAVAKLIKEIKNTFPSIKIVVWTGYFMSELINSKDKSIDSILNTIDYLVDGPYMEEERDITLWLRGSRNQKVWKKLTNEKKYDIIEKTDEGDF